jgi:hypothetical protein
MRNDDLVKMALTACISIIVTGATAWLVFGQDKITRSDAEVLVNRMLTTSHRELDLRISSNSETAQRLEASVTELVKAQQAVVIEQRVLIERVNTLVDRMAR